MRKLLMILLLISLGLMGTNVYCQNKKDYKELNKYIKDYVDKYEMPGFAVGVIKNGEVIFMESYGNKNNDVSGKVDENTLFGIASCSKAFTSAAISILVEQGKLSWKDKVVDHYPGFKLFDPYITAELTIEDLLSHRSGFETFDGDLIWYGNDRTTEEVVARMQYRENPFGLREKFGYSNLMFITAGEVIKHTSGLSWPEFIDKYIFDAIDMPTSNATNDGFENNADAAWPHIDGQAMEFINYDNIGAAGAINSSISEMMQWAFLMLNKGKIGDSIIFSERNYYKMVTQHTMLNAGRAETIGGTHFAGYGLGWFLKDYKGKKIIYHGGGLPGFHSKVVVIPEDSLAYVILANQLSGLVPAIDRKIMELHLNPTDTTNWAELYLESEKKQKQRLEEKWVKLESERIKDTKMSIADSSYCGIYEDKMYGKAEISLDEGELKIVLLPTAKLFTSNMEHWHYNTFKIEFTDPFLPPGFVIFDIDVKGELSGFSMDMDAPDFHFNKLDFKRVEN